MANTYRPVSDRAKALYGEKDFEAEFTATEEQDMLSGGHLEIVPRSYKVLSSNYAAGKQDSVIDLALPVEVEAALLDVHLERVEKPAAKKKAQSSD